MQVPSLLNKSMGNHQLLAMCWRPMHQMSIPSPLNKAIHNKWLATLIHSRLMAGM